MRFGVKRGTLLLTAGLVWLAAGVNILRIGLVTWSGNGQFWLWKAAEAAAVFLLFYRFVFRRLLERHSRRIGDKGEKSCPFSFFDASGWIVMAVMVGFGMAARRYGWLPVPFIAVFYTGLGAALGLTGGLFLVRWRKERKEDLHTPTEHA